MIGVFVLIGFMVFLLLLAFLLTLMDNGFCVHKYEVLETYHYRDKWKPVTTVINKCTKCSRITADRY